MPTQNVSISARRTAGVRITLCSASTHSFACTSYPVFSAGTTDGTAHYAAGTPLKQLSPAGSYAAANNPAVSYNATSGTGLITFTYGQTFDGSADEYAAGATPRRYRYILHLAGHTPATAFSSAVTASTAVLLSGTVSVYLPATAASSSISICTLEVV